MRKFSSIAIACTLATASFSAQAALYSVEALQFMDGFPGTTTGINNLDQISGYSQINGFSHAVRWDGTSLTDLGTLGGTSSFGYGINDLGQIAGMSSTSNGSFHATLWTGATPTDLGAPLTTSQVNFSLGASINNNGQVVGNSDSDIGGLHAVIWNGSTATDLGTLGGPISLGSAINNSGEVTGTSWLTTDGLVPSHAFLWNGVQLNDLGTLGGTDSNGLAINDAGLVAGTSNLSGDILQHAFLWDGTHMTDLGTLGGSDSTAYGINNAGIVVGSSGTGGDEDHGVLWDNGKIIDLNSLLDPASKKAGWIIVSASDINDKGDISAMATTSQGGLYPVLLTAEVPEPAAYDLLLIGFGVISFGMQGRRREFCSSKMMMGSA